MNPLLILFLMMGGLLALLMLLSRPLGEYMGDVLEREPVAWARFLSPVERGLYRLMGIDGNHRMDWKQYLGSLLAFNALGLAFLFGLLRLQHHLPLNSQGFGPMSLPLAFNTAASFVTNTNWQAYSGEAALGHLAQMLGLTVQNFLSAATGLCAMAALARGIRRRKATNLGSFWVDVTRITLYVLLPLSILFALLLVSQGTVQTLVASVKASWLAAPVSGAAPEQTLALGPVASQMSIAILGTNGGGFFGANFAHPLTNPTMLANLASIFCILFIPAACCFTFGKMVRDRRQGWALFAAMSLILVMATALAGWSERQNVPAVRQVGIVQTTGNLEGKELRNGVESSALWSTVTTAVSCGAVNAQHDSMSPLAGMSQLVLMHIGEVAFGGVGSGLYGMLIFVFIAVFISGLMVGRTPEYLGKKVEAFEMKMGALAVLTPSVFILLGTALAVLHPKILTWVSNTGPHAFSQVLYAWTSASANNGSAYGGFTADTPFTNIGLGLAMLGSRFAPIAAVLAIAGSLAAKKRTPPGPGTLPTHGPFFVVVLVGIVLLVGALTFLPALALGPIAEFFARI